jgi:hypothetical protein
MIENYDKKTSVIYPFHAKTNDLKIRAGAPAGIS